MMYGLLMAHSGWRWLVILAGLVFLVRMLWGWFGKDQWRPLDQRLGLILTIVVDIQVLLGIILWIIQQRWTGANPLASFEHPFTMLLGVAIMHVGWSRAKKADESSRFRQAALWVAVAAVLIALGIVRIDAGG